MNGLVPGLKKTQEIATGIPMKATMINSENIASFSACRFSKITSSLVLSSWVPASQPAPSRSSVLLVPWARGDSSDGDDGGDQDAKERPGQSGPSGHQLSKEGTQGHRHCATQQPAHGYRRGRWRDMQDHQRAERRQTAKRELTGGDTCHERKTDSQGNR